MIVLRSNTQPLVKQVVLIGRHLQGSRIMFCGTYHCLQLLILCL